MYLAKRDMRLNFAILNLLKFSSFIIVGTAQAIS